jgi:hypothetical protein
MEHEKIIASSVELAAPLNVKDIRNNKKILVNVGEAARFIRANFSRQRSDSADWEHAAKALEVAAETNDAERRQHATEAVVALLRAEGMLPAEISGKQTSNLS